MEGSDATRAMQKGLRQPHLIRTRYLAAVSATNQRITYAGRAFDIRSVVDVDLRQHTLEITADEVTP